MAVTVIIPAFNAEATITAQLAAVLAQDIDVIVADNGSTDRTATIATIMGARVVDASQVRGPAHARNAGAAAADTDLLLFCDADDVVGPGWVEAHLRTLAEADLSIGTLRYVNALGHDHEWAPASGPWPNNHLGYLPAGGSGNLGVRAATWAALAGMDETMRAGEDIDFCWRAQQAGHEVGHTPDAVVNVTMRTTLGGLARQSVQFGRADVDLYVRHRTHGMKPYRPGKTLRTYGWLIRHIPDAIVDSGWRGKWTRVAASRVGRLQRSAHHRCVYL